jgi:hypothetical protein
MVRAGEVLKTKGRGRYIHPKLAEIDEHNSR